MPEQILSADTIARLCAAPTDQLTATRCLANRQVERNRWPSHRQMFAELVAAADAELARRQRPA